MKLDRMLIILTVNAIFWSLINSAKNNNDKNELTRVGETSKDNDGAESSVNARIQMLKPKSKIAKKGTTKDNQEEKKLNRSEYMKIYRQNNKENSREYHRRYRQNNKERMNKSNRKYKENNREKTRESARKYYQNNKEKKSEDQQKYRKNNREKLKEYEQKYRENNREEIRKSDRNYYQNNREKRKESGQKCREKRKNKKENLKNVDPIVGNIFSNNTEGTSFVRNDFRDKGKLPIVYEEGIQFEVGSLFNQEEEETETHMEEQNQTVVEEPTKINSINQSDSDEEDYLRYLNDRPYDDDEDVY